MGAMLTQPVTEKESHEDEGLGLKYGISSMQGWRSEMEDAHDVKLGLKYGLKDWSFFAVFDGHAGKRAAAYAAWNLLDFILRDSQFKLNPESSRDLTHVNPDFDRNDLISDEYTNEIKKEAKSRDQSTTSESNSCSTESGQPEKDQGENINKIQTIDIAKNDDTSAKLDSVDPKFASYPILEQLPLVQKAIRSAFLNIDESMRQSAHDVSGCTAVCTLISPTHLFIANCGDSRAVFYDGTCARFATEDHKPFHPKERQRIIDAGGCATQRINGTLAVSRALGDFEFKKDAMRGPCEQLVSPEPEITTIKRQPRDEFLILACDGIWDVMSNEDICEFVRYKLRIEPSLKKICSSVLDVCLHKGSRDNMSIIIVVFENGPRFSESERERDIKNDQILRDIANSVCDKMSGDFNEFLYGVKESLLSQPHQDILPPGAGIEAKYDLLDEIFRQKSDQQTDTNAEE